MKVVYIAHPFGAPTITERLKNRSAASEWVKWAIEQGCAPVADWIIITSLFEDTKENRKRGLEIDCVLVARCDELWICGTHVSPGMQIEIDAAKAFNVLVVDMRGIHGTPKS